MVMLASGCSLDDAGLLGELPDAEVDAVVPDSGSADVAVDGPATVDAALDAPAEAEYDAGVEAGPILTITGGSYTLLGLDAGVCSLNGNTATSFQLTNDRDASVDLIWVDYSCNEQPYGVIAPLNTKPQGTYVTHVWRIRNDSDSAFLAEFVLNAVGTYTVTVH